MAKPGSKLVFDCVEIPKRHRSRSMRPSLSAASSNTSSGRSTNLTTPSASPDCRDVAEHRLRVRDTTLGSELGLANEGEFDSLGAEAALQTEVIDVFMEYLHGNEDKYSKGLFENVFVQLDPTSSTLYDAWETRRRAPKPAQRAAIERSLRENNGLQIGYAVLVYAGPMLEEEIRDIVAAREERRTREAPWKVAVEQYEADLKIWKKAAKRAKAKGEAEPPKPERPEKPKKPQKARKQAKRAGGKGVKPAKRTQRVQEEMEDEEDEQEAHDEDDSEGGEQEEEQDDEE
ncbi:hypothetical protein NBRC10512_006672 [Rhodotorula toruloides]